MYHLCCILSFFLSTIVGIGESCECSESSSAVVVLVSVLVVVTVIAIVVVVVLVMVIIILMKRLHRAKGNSTGHQNISLVLYKGDPFYTI